jgi:hypothetical protein
MEQRKEATGNIKLLTPRRISPQLKRTIILQKELKFVNSKQKWNKEKKPQETSNYSHPEE